MPPKKSSSSPPPIPPLVFIDGSFFCFWRAGATSVWFSRHTGKGEPEDCHVDNPEFLNYYQSQFLSSLEKLLKRVKVPIPKGTPKTDLPNLPQVFWFRDTPQDQLWRKPLHPNYKGSRADPVQPTDPDAPPLPEVKKSALQKAIGPLIRWTYENLISTNKVIRAPTCEADDGIAVATRHEQTTNPTQPITIISGDSDLLQLINPPLTIQINPKSNPQFKPSIIEFKVSSSNKPILSPELYLLAKIIAGDSTDDIPQIFTGCGPATALNLAQNPTLFTQQVKNHTDPTRYQNYLLNQTLIDLSKIPAPLQQQLLTQYLKTQNKTTIPKPKLNLKPQPKLTLKFKKIL